MRKSFIFSFALTFCLIPPLFAQTEQPKSQGPAARQGCKTIDAHCVCQNPTKDFTIKNHKWGKSNVDAGESGVCRYVLDIEEALKKAPVRFCMSGEPISRDPRKGETTCQVNWTCAEPCTF